MPYEVLVKRCGSAKISEMFTEAEKYIVRPRIGGVRFRHFNRLELRAARRRVLSRGRFVDRLTKAFRHDGRRV